MSKWWWLNIYRNDSTSAERTIRNSIYCIPFIICFLESHPRFRHTLWVNCQDDMIIKEGLICVASSSEASHPNLWNWRCHSFNVVSLVMKLRDNFPREIHFVAPNLYGDLSREHVYTFLFYLLLYPFLMMMIISFCDRPSWQRFLIDNDQNDILIRIASLIQNEENVAFVDQVYIFRLVCLNFFLYFDS